MKRFCRYIRYAGMLFRYALALLIGIFARHTPAYRDLWLFAERGYDAQDNAFLLFQFVRQKHPEINARTMETLFGWERQSSRAAFRIIWHLPAQR